MGFDSGFEDRERVNILDGWWQGIPELGSRAAESSTPHGAEMERFDPQNTFLCTIFNFHLQSFQLQLYIRSTGFFQKLDFYVKYYEALKNKILTLKL